MKHLVEITIYFRDSTFELFKITLISSNVHALTSNKIYNTSGIMFSECFGKWNKHLCTNGNILSKKSSQNSDIKLSISV